jgi:hypothetical protein
MSCHHGSLHTNEAESEETWKGVVKQENGAEAYAPSNRLKKVNHISDNVIKSPYPLTR